MAPAGVERFLENKCLLVTGASGFLAKVFIEKILRVQPNVRRLYLLVRAADVQSAMQRLYSEVFDTALFSILRNKLGHDMKSFISEKVVAVPGEVSCEDIGIKDAELKQRMLEEIEVVVNIAATTNFDERYDVAFGTNTMGPWNVLEFAKRCTHIRLLLHVSTAYVCGERSGFVMERPFHMGETLTENQYLDITEEKKLLSEKLNKVKASTTYEQQVVMKMKDLGFQRAKLYGWPNTYVFTKAMGEMLLGWKREKLPLVILRPTIITSTYNEPFPGWIEGFRTANSVRLSLGKGRLKFYAGKQNIVQDFIPVDMVVNAMITTMVAHANKPGEFVYHISSSKNPLTFKKLKEYAMQYFDLHPFLDSQGFPIKLCPPKLFNSISSFEAYITLRYIFPLTVMQLFSKFLCGYNGRKYDDLKCKIKFQVNLSRLYKPYSMSHGRFDTKNLEHLMNQVVANMEFDEAISFDPKFIDWEKYVKEIYLPGLQTHMVKR